MVLLSLLMSVCWAMHSGKDYCRTIVKVYQKHVASLQLNPEEIYGLPSIHPAFKGLSEKPFIVWGTEAPHIQIFFKPKMDFFQKSKKGLEQLFVNIICDCNGREDDKDAHEYLEEICTECYNTLRICYWDENDEKKHRLFLVSKDATLIRHLLTHLSSQGSEPA